MRRSAKGSLTALAVVALAFSGAGCRHTTSSPVPHATISVESTAVDSAATIYSAANVPIPELGYNAREGRALYRHYCLNCHGDEGAGDGFNAYNLDPKPASLADSTFQARHSDADLLTAIRSGGAAVGLSTGMPPWGRTLNDRQTQNIVEYLRTFGRSK
jgi:mono/diheme cytochrome c family protein